MENSPVSPFSYSHWCEAIALVADASIYECGASNALSDDIKFSFVPHHASQFSSSIRVCGMNQIFAERS